MKTIKCQPLPVTAISEGELDVALVELRALDEMERLALTQVAAARQRKREILLAHGTPLAGSMRPKILVMRPHPAPQALVEHSLS